MKTKKLTLPFLILLVTVFAIVMHSIVSSIAKQPSVTEHDFAFSITYELDGERITIDDVYAVHYDSNGGYSDTKSRIYVGKIGDKEENDTGYILRQDAEGRVELDTKFYPDHLMGDAWYDYFDEDAFEPKLYYYDAEETEYTDEETLLAHGVKLVSFEYPKPIENTLVFSHISRLNAQVVLPTLLISVVALLMMLTCVRREKKVVSERVEIQSTIMFVKNVKKDTRATIDNACVVMNFVIGIIAVPFFTIVEMFSDISADNDTLSHMMMYFTPALTVLCLAASVGLRRKGFSKSALVVQFLGPVIWGLLLLFGTIGLC